MTITPERLARAALDGLWVGIGELVGWFVFSSLVRHEKRTHR